MDNLYRQLESIRRIDTTKYNNIPYTGPGTEELLLDVVGIDFIVLDQDTLHLGCIAARREVLGHDDWIARQSDHGSDFGTRQTLANDFSPNEARRAGNYELHVVDTGISMKCLMSRLHVSKY